MQGLFDEEEADAREPKRRHGAMAYLDDDEERMLAYLVAVVPVFKDGRRGGRSAVIKKLIRVGYKAAMARAKGGSAA